MKSILGQNYVYWFSNWIPCILKDENSMSCGNVVFSSCSFGYCVKLCK